MIRVNAFNYNRSIILQFIRVFHTVKAVQLRKHLYMLAILFIVARYFQLSPRLYIDLSMHIPVSSFFMSDGPLVLARLFRN